MNPTPDTPLRIDLAQLMAGVSALMRWEERVPLNETLFAISSLNQVLRELLLEKVPGAAFVCCNCELGRVDKPARSFLGTALALAVDGQLVGLTGPTTPENLREQALALALEEAQGREWTKGEPKYDISWDEQVDAAFTANPLPNERVKALIGQAIAQSCAVHLDETGMLAQGRVNRARI